jgi:hypothetical protein
MTGTLRPVPDRPPARSTDVRAVTALPLAASEPEPAAAAAPLSAATFEALYRATVDDLFAYVAAVVRDHGVAEDVVAAAFERAYRRLRTYDPSRGTQRQWLFGIRAPRGARRAAPAPAGGVARGRLPGPSNAGTRLHRAVRRLREACHAPS